MLDIIHSRQGWVEELLWMVGLVGVGVEYFYAFIRLTNYCEKEPNLCIKIKKVRLAGTAEPIDTSNYLIVKEQYTNWPVAIIKEVGLTQDNIEAIKERLIPRIAGMIRQWE